MVCPAPLVPAFVDLRDFQFMPLDVVRLRDSRISALVSGEEFRSAVLLWCASWHQVPAASLPDDDIELAQLAGFGRMVAAWREVRGGALYGWVKCSDGRFYHPTVVEKAIEGWNAKAAHQWKKECDRIRKENKAREQRQEPPFPLPDRPAEIGCGTTIAVEPVSAVTVERIPNEGSDFPGGAKAASTGNADPSGGIPAEPIPFPAENPQFPAENALKGQGEGQGDLLDPSLRSGSCPEPGKPVRTRAAYPADFEEFWKPYPTDPNMSKSDAAKAWAKLTKDERASATAAIPGFVAYCRANPTYRPVHAVRFLTSRRFEGFAIAAQARSRDSPPRPSDPAGDHLVDVGNGELVSVPLFRAMVGRGAWVPKWGPKRGEPGCSVPDWLWPAATKAA